MRLKNIITVFLLLVFASSNSYCQKIKKKDGVNKTISITKFTPSACVDDSLVSPDDEKGKIFDVSNDENKNSLILKIKESAMLKNLGIKILEELKREEVFYQLKVDEDGNVIETSYVSDFHYKNIVDTIIVNCIKSIDGWKVPYYIKNGINKKVTNRIVVEIKF